MNKDNILQLIADLPDEAQQYIALSSTHNGNMSLSDYYASRKDEDGFTLHVPGGIKKISGVFKYLQQICWDKFCDNPQVRTSIIDMMGRVAGKGFGVSSEEFAIQDTLDMISDDPRNRLHTLLPKYYARSEIEGELYLIFTVHPDGFVEIDFRDPGTLGGAYSNTGIVSLKRKPNLPLIYCFESCTDMDGNAYEREQIPSIFAARYPNLLQDCIKEQNRAVSLDLLDKNKDSNPAYRPFGGYKRFVVAWDKGFLTTRNVGHLRTVIKWVNLYENLKLYEVDHKKSSGAYLWSVEFTDKSSFAAWNALTDDQKKATGILSPKAPGGTLLLPPGMRLIATNPTLPKISDADTDIISMVGSGLNTSTTAMMGTENATYASAKSGQAPISDRISDATCWFETFLTNDVWDNIFFLRSAMKHMPAVYKRRACVGFKGKKPIMQDIDVPARKLIDYSFPYSEMANLQGLTSAFFGVKHGSLADVMGVPRAELIKRLGFGNYAKLRQVHATEEEMYPELLDPVDQGNNTGDEQQQQKPKEDVDE